VSARGRAAVLQGRMQGFASPTARPGDRSCRPTGYAGEWE
jgi:hypothetical protein